MVKWLKIEGNQYFGFWILGLVLFVLQEVPYMIMPLFKLGSNPIMNMRETSVFFNICEKILGSLCIASMVFIVQKDMTLFSFGKGISKVGFVLAMAVLLFNYWGWLLYFNGHQSMFVMMFFIVMLPPLYYVCIGLWRGNRALVVTGMIFEMVHFACGLPEQFFSAVHWLGAFGFWIAVTERTSGYV